VKNRSKAFTRLLALLMAFGVLAAACGSSVDDAVDAAEDVEDAAEDVVDDATDAAEDAVEDVEDAVDEAMEDGEVGSIVDGVATGTAGFTIDTNACPDGWSNTQGVTDDEVLLGHSFIFSGTLAGYGAISDGMKAWFEAKSAEDPEAYGGRTVTLVAKDDGYEPARTVSNITELLEKDGIFAAASMAGTPNNLAVYDTLNDECVPHLFAATGHPAWGDPVNHPWTTPSFLSYTTEGQVWAQYILGLQDSGDLPNPTTVGNLTMNNDFGLAMLNGFKGAVDQSDGRIEIVGDELHDPSAPNLVNEITTLAGTDADVVIVGTAGVACTQGMTGVAESSWEPKEKIIAAVCFGAGQFEPAAAAGDGWVLTGGLKDIRSEQYDGDETVEEGRRIFDDAGVDWKQNANAGSALLYSIPTLEALKAANELPGGITRTNLVIGARALDFQHPYYADGIRWHMDGLDDAYTIEATQLVKHALNDDIGYAEPEPVGDIIDVDGTTDPCEWDGQTC